MSNAVTKRLAMSMITAAVADFVGSGYLAMLSFKSPERKFIVAKDLHLTVRYDLTGSKETYTFQLINGKTGVREQIVHTLRRGDLGITEVTEPALSMPAIQWLPLANRLATAFNTLYQNVDALGKVKTYEGRGNGHSATEKDGVSEAWTTSRNNAPLGGVSA